MRCAHGETLLRRLCYAHPSASRFNIIKPARSVTDCLQRRPYRTRKAQEIEAQGEDEYPSGNAAPAGDDGLPDCKPNAANTEDDALKKPKRGRKPRAKKGTSAVLDTVRSQITPGSQHHHDLPSFLSYAETTSLSAASKTYLGTHFEYTVSAALERLGFRLTRVGGVSDLGVDLLGHWAIPCLPHPLPTFIQCKATTPQAVMVRELEGTSAPPNWRGDSTIAFLAASKVATKGVRDAIARSSLPMGFLCITADEGLVRQFIWNQAAVQKCGLEGVGVGLKHPEESVVLTWQGEPWPSLSKKTGDEGKQGVAA